MTQLERYEYLVIGGGNGGGFLAWHLASLGHRTAVIERRWIGGSCPNVNCLPTKNEIWSAKVAHLIRGGRHFGAITGPVSTDMTAVRRRKREMVEGMIALTQQMSQGKRSGTDHGLGALHGAEDGRGQAQ
jgi:pyruvate/2-oxoglutarate dehydrogenase complex dihydrolipoamide dehydrogenase (E3) component